MSYGRNWSVSLGRGLIGEVEVKRKKDECEWEWNGMGWWLD